MSDKVILDVKNLRTVFNTQDGTVHAVNGISYVLHEGEALGIVGESGCGKTVSMLSVLRLLKEPPANISADKLIFQGQDMLELSNAELRNIRGGQMAMIFQDPMTSLNPVLTVGFQLREPLIHHLGLSKDEAENRVVELLELVGISDARSRLKDYPHQFSGGMRQRAMIAMALSCTPLVLIADEPTTALDVTIQAQIVELVQRLREQIGMAMIWITHDLGVMAGLADRVIVMYAGYIAEEAMIDDLYQNPRHPYTQALLGSLPRLDGTRDKKLRTIEGLPPDLISLPKGCPFAERCTMAREKCLEENPPLEELDSNRRLACWVNIDTGDYR